MTTYKILGLCGSLRSASVNKKLLHEAVRLFGSCQFNEHSLRLPLYDGDLEEQGLPQDVTELANAIANADGIIIASPEYNKALSGVLKNALDWVSRVQGSVWRNKPVAIISAAAGRTGGETAQFTLRHALTPFDPDMISAPTIYVAGAQNEFDANNQLTNERYKNALEQLMKTLRQRIENNLNH